MFYFSDEYDHLFYPVPLEGRPSLYNVQIGAIRALASRWSPAIRPMRVTQNPTDGFRLGGRIVPYALVPSPGGRSFYVLRCHCARLSDASNQGNAIRQ
jgi:hypothetical protein